MKSTAAIWMSLTLAACTTAPAPQRAIRIDIVQGKLVQLWNVSATQVAGSTVVEGFARRARTPTAPVNEHLHVAAIDEAGRVVVEREVEWNGTFSVRSNASVSFRTELFDQPGADVSYVRLEVVHGSLHPTDSAR